MKTSASKNASHMSGESVPLDVTAGAGAFGRWRNGRERRDSWRDRAWAAVLLVAAWSFVDRARGDIVIAPRQDQPYLVLDARGPTATPWGVAFSPDSSRVYVGGLDKAVHVWDVTVPARSVLRTAPNRAVLVQTLRWEIARGTRGTIYTIAASPVDRRLAIAGFSARDATGDIVVVDTATGRVVRPLLGHRGPVSSLSFSPSGRQLVSYSADGELRVWSTERDAPPRILLPAGRREQNTVGRALFLREDLVLVGEPPVMGADGKSRSARALLIPLDDGAKPIPLEPVHQGMVTALARHPKGTAFATADESGRIYFYSSPDDTAGRQLRQSNRIAIAMDMDAAGRLFVATRRAGAASYLEMWDPASGEMEDEVETARQEHNFLCGVSPDGSRVVTLGGDDNAVRVYLLKDREGAPIDKPLARAPLALAGLGRKIFRVAFTDEERYRVGFSTVLDSPPTEVFALTNPSLGPTPDGTVFRDSARLKGHSIRVRRDNPRTLILFADDRQLGEIHLSSRQGLPRAFAWLQDRAEQPVGLAVATDRDNGIFVYRLAGGGECPLVRHFRDHVAPAVSLSISRDGKYLASGGFDQTIKVWSLAGLTEVGDADPMRLAWGGKIDVANGRAEWVEVAQESALTRKGLRRGDVVVAATVADRSPDAPRDSVRTIRDAQQIVGAIRELPLTETVVLRIERNGVELPRPILLMPAWEPLLSVFIARTGEWAMWSPRGYYDSSVEGDKLFGWQLNRGLSTAPDFYPAEQLREGFERPGVIRRLLELGSLTEALRADGGPGAAAEDTATALDRRVKATPRVEVLEPTHGAEFAVGDVKVVARVRFPDPNLQGQAKSKAYINGVPGKLIDTKQEAGTQVLTWKAPARHSHNRLRILTEADDPTRLLGASDVHFRGRGVETKTPRLHLWSISVANYQRLRKLPLTRADADALVDLLSKQSGKFYVRGEFQSLSEGEVTRERLTKEVALWTKRLAAASPDDLLVVFIAGHGVAIGSDYYFLPADVEERRQSIVDRGVSWKVFRELASVPCRKLFLLDTCHAGSAQADAADPAARWKNPVRPLAQDDILVLSATDVGQEAFEAGEHGVFTQCLLEGLAGAADADPKDGDIFLGEIEPFVIREVPERVGRLSRSLRQTPRGFPVELFDAVSIPLVVAPKPAESP